MSEQLEGLSVLIVEDDFNVAEALRAVLVAAGCRVVGPASTVAEACRLVKKEQLDVAILDIALSPGTTSEPVARALLSRGCPFIFVTGFSSVDMLSEELRGQRVLVKPIDADELCAAVRAVVRRVA